MLSRLLFVVLLFFTICVYAVPPSTIIIDPGHGGKDPGATFKKVKEKDITLAVSLLLTKQLQKQLKNVAVELTRSTDVFHSAVEKAEIANQKKGELFVSIHANSVLPSKRRYYRYIKKPYYVKENGKRIKKYKKVRKYYYVNTYNDKVAGTEIFIWSSDKSDDKGNVISAYDELHAEGREKIPDLNSPEAKLLGQLYAQRFFKRSFKLATMVDAELRKIGRVCRGVKQRNNKGIWVLQATAMPAILIELGFITNKEEAQYMMSKKGQLALANAIAQAIVRYIKS